MTIKRILGPIVGLLFICSVIYLMAQPPEPGFEPSAAPVSEASAPAAGKPKSPAKASVEKASAKTKGAEAERQAAPRVVAYYFHGHSRCYTCRMIESYSETALKSAFAAELGSGVLAWHPLNVELPENKHFIKDYRLYTKSLILSRMKEGEEVEWKNLDRIWRLVRDREAFAKYVQEETSAYLEKE